MEQDFKSTTVKCLACGFLAAILIAGEILPDYCPKCKEQGKDSLLHIEQEHFEPDFFGRQALAGMSSTLTSVSVSPSAEYIYTDWNGPQNPTFPNSFENL
jgi:hypothetical protein